MSFQAVTVIPATRMMEAVMDTVIKQAGKPDFRQPKHKKKSLNIRAETKTGNKKSYVKEREREAKCCRQLIVMNFCNCYV